MRKIFTLLIIVSSIYLYQTIIIFADEQYDFRKVRWGMSRDEVKASEPNKLEDKNDTMIAYRYKVAGMESRTVYVFTKEKLVQAGYTFVEKHSNLNIHISDYGKIKEILIQKYGLPTMDQQLWYNDLYKDYPQKWGFAVSISHLDYYSSWENETTRIILALAGENYEVLHRVSYESKDFIHLREDEEQKKKQEDF